MSLYALTLPMPAGLDDERAGSFASAPCVESAFYWDGPALLAGTASRQNRNHRAPWILQWLFDSAPDAARFAVILEAYRADMLPDMPPVSANALKLEEMPEDGWLEKSYQQAAPFRASGFYIYGSHTDNPEPGADIPLLIDAATAFGSGDHGTTAGCLQLLQHLKGSGIRPASVLDIGTGSGILAIAAWRLWGAPVLATDIDPEAVRVAARHRDINDVPEADMECFIADGFAAAKLQQNKTYDLIIANILAAPLKNLCDGLLERTSAFGHIVLSGMLEEQAVEVCDLYCSKNCTKILEDRRLGWTSLLLKKQAA